MRDCDYETKLDGALKDLRDEDSEVATDGFEHKVWSEISIQSERKWLDVFRWFSGRRSFGIPIPASAILTVFAVAMGSALAIFQSAAYGKQAELALEQQYVESIHPVLMSSNHTAPDPPR